MRNWNSTGSHLEPSTLSCSETLLAVCDEVRHQSRIHHSLGRLVGWGFQAEQSSLTQSWGCRPVVWHRLMPRGWWRRIWIPTSYIYSCAKFIQYIYINIIYSYTTSYIHYYSYSNAELFRMLAPSTWRAFLDPGRPSEILELPPHLGSSRSIGIAGDQWLSMGTTMVIACDNLTYTLGQSKIAMENHDRSILNGFSTAISYTIALCHCSFLIPRVYLELQILRLEPRPQALATWWGCRPH